MSVNRRTNKDGKTIGWQAQILTRDPMTGRRVRRTVGTYPTKKAAEQAEREALAHRDRGTLLNPSTTTVAELLDAWLDTKSGEITANSLKDYEIIIRRHLKPALGAIRVQELRPDRVQAQYAQWREQGMSARMIRGCHMRLSQALDYAVKVQLAHTNVCQATTPPRLAKVKVETWSPEEAQRFLETAVTDSLAPLWHLLLLEGMRRGEALGLRWQDINWGKDTAGKERVTAHIVQTVAPDKAGKGGVIIQPRTKTAAGARTVRLTPETVAALREHRDRQRFRRQQAGEAWPEYDLIICTSVGTPINPNNVTRSFKALVKRAGMRELRVHDLRHTSATLLLLRGVPAKIVSERLGHASISITLDTYSHVLPDMQDQAVDAMSDLFSTTGS